jgi:hypothetical protein
MLGVKGSLFEGSFYRHERERKWWRGRVNARRGPAIRRLQSGRMHPEFALAKKNMHWIDRAEAKFGHLAIPGLLRYVAGFNALCFVLWKLNPYFLEFLFLKTDLVMQGQVWRLVTYIFIPQIGGLFPDWLGAAMYIYYLVWIGDGLEEAIGQFRTTLFYFVGMVGTTIAGFIVNADPSGAILNASLLFAFARFYADTTIYIYYILPVKVKWLAWLTAILIFWGFVTGSWGYRASVIVALLNYWLFFGRDIVQEARHRQEVSGRRQRFEKAVPPDEEAMHHCAVCGRTELVAPDLEFRVARDGEEYCVEHLPKTPPVLPPAQP